MKKEVHVIQQAQSNLVKELEVLATCLVNSSMLVLKENGTLLECQFVLGGLTHHVLQVKNRILASGLQRMSVKGIIEGAYLTAFRNNFGSFSLHVKARQLYFELSATQAEYPLEVPQLAVA
jgi:hypothetical protein